MPRLSRNEALRTLDQIIAAALEFTGDEESAAITHAARSMRDFLDMSREAMPDARIIRDLRTRVAALQAARLFNSATIRPLTSPAITVYLFGPQSPDATGEAAEVAAVELSTDSHLLRLVDVTPVSTATWTGARYTFRVRAAWDPAPTPAPAPAEAPSAAPAAL